MRRTWRTRSTTADPAVVPPDLLQTKFPRADSISLKWLQMDQHAPEAERLLRLPYHISLVRDGQGDDERCWTARVEELPGCEVRERTPEEATRAISDAMEGWLDAALQEGAEIPEPRRPSTHSGRLLLRMPQELHSEMARRAESEEVSLNVYITSVLAGTVGWPRNGAAANGSSGGLAGNDPPARPRFLSVAIMTNIVVLVIVGIAAVVLLVGALLNGW
jgi:antitoxin HicB